jgi:hypothetical protein
LPSWRDRPSDAGRSVLRVEGYRDTLIVKNGDNNAQVRQSGKQFRIRAGTAKEKRVFARRRFIVAVDRMTYRKTVLCNIGVKANRQCSFGNARSRQQHDNKQNKPAYLYPHYNPSFAASRLGNFNNISNVANLATADSFSVVVYRVSTYACASTLLNDLAHQRPWRTNRTAF